MPGCASSARRKKKMESAANRRLFWTTAGAVVAADLVTKLLAESLLSRHLPVQVIGEYLQLRLGFNQCAAFGLCLSAELTSVLLSHSEPVCCLLLERQNNIRDAEH